MTPHQFGEAEARDYARLHPPERTSRLHRALTLFMAFACFIAVLILLAIAPKAFANAAHDLTNPPAWAGEGVWYESDT